VTSFSSSRRALRSSFRRKPESSVSAFLLLCRSAELRLAFGEPVTFFACAKKGNQRNTPPVARPPGILPSGSASGGRVPLTGHPWPAAESARSLAPTLRAFSTATRRATGGPVWAASCRRSKCKSSRSVGVEATEVCCAVQGCTDSWINAPFAVPSIAGDGEKGPKGRAHDARASAAVHGCTVSRPRRCREAQGSSIRTMRIEPPRWALDLFGYFLGQCQKVTRSPIGRVKALLMIPGSETRRWIPAFAGMTRMEKTRRAVADPDSRTNREREKTPSGASL